MLETLQYKSTNGLRAIRCWFIPYVFTRIHADEFRPVLCYLYTDWKCNIDCHYCFQYNNEEPGMTLETAKSSMDWLKSIGCRVIALMGGEPLVRRDFILDVIRYGASNGLFMYLPTNGYLMDKAFIDEMGKAGVAAVNLAVDCVSPRKGLPKALMSIEPQFRYLIEKQTKYGYIIFFNINICRTNLRDVKLLTEIAHQNHIGTDYHLNEPPQDRVNVDFYKHHNDDGLSITPDQFEEVDDLLDWICEKQRQGWGMVNSIAHLQAFKDRMRGNMKTWDCRAGHNGALIRTDGTLAPCFDLMSYDYDWGRIWEPNFDKDKLEEIKKDCIPFCSSTCFYTMGHYYQTRMVYQWIRKHTVTG
ncbi:MAG: radical SAM protein [Deltaproteobacteria bacterium]|nr:radical SAM protein [Deltaproteobacteria bacterium]MBW2051498.1 radical SAM protein [Deltaproteobacteria bacterium]MBW2140354.1 radical SAM protein [Deltaproteobacteria bacterium]MBW2323725.1 radical SAM protein [Deltaproteobacteria bacterium]